MLQGSFPRVCLARLTSAILCCSTFIKVAMDYRLSSAAAFKPQCITFPVTRKKKLWQKCKRQQSKMKSLRTTLHFFHFNSIRRMRSLSHFTAFAMPWNGRRLVEKSWGLEKQAFVLIFHRPLDIASRSCSLHAFTLVYTLCICISHTLCEELAKVWR